MDTSSSRSRVGLLVVLLAVGAPAVPAAAQTDASIYGLVTDESGGVLPGVTITVTSPALQVPSIAAVTEVNGEFRITPLPIGIYRVEFALTGFQTIIEQDVRLTVGFAAKLDVKMHVGSIEEAITVSGTAPVVDVTATSSSMVLTKETLELTPTSRQSLASLFAQAPGVRTNLDVGGSTLNAIPAVSAFGQPGEPQTFIEGVLSTALQSTGGNGNYWDYLTVEETQISTVGNSAEAATRGVLVNGIVKSGGNEFHGQAGFSKSGHQLQSNNIGEDLRAIGITTGNKLLYRNDLHADMGGRIITGKLWFYGAARDSRTSEEVLEVLQPDGSPAATRDIGAFHTEKLTYQMTKSNRIVFFNQFTWKDTIESVTPFTAWETRTQRTVKNYNYKGEWQGLKGNWLVFSTQASYYGHGADPHAAPNYAPGLPYAIDIGTQRETGPSLRTGQRNLAQMRDVKARVTIYKPELFFGDHEFKAGFNNTFSELGRTNPISEDLPTFNYRLRFQNGNPIEIEVPNTPNIPREVENYSGLFVQDRWRIGRRITLDVGIRHAVDIGYVTAACREAALPPGQFVFPAGCFPKTSFPTWHPWDPRVHMAVDLTGDGKTVLKGGWGNFSHQTFLDELSQLDPLAPATARYRWRDLNGNRNYDDGEVNLSPTGPDFITQTLIVGRANPDLIEPTSNEYMASIERQLMPFLAVRALGVYSKNVDNYRVTNVMRPPSAYSIPVTRPDPGPDNRVGTADDPGVNFTYFEYPTSLVGQRFEVPMYINDSRRDATFKSFEFGAVKQFSNRWFFSASFSATRKHAPLISALIPSESAQQAGQGAADNPNAEINTTDDTWERNNKLSGSYEFPYKLRFGVNFQNRSGIPFARQVLFSGGATIPSIVLNVEPIGTQQRPAINLLDMRIERSFAFGKSRKVSARLNVYNVTNASTATNMNARAGTTYLRPTAILPARIMELNATFSY
jgi:hypothetical protein